MNIIMRRRSLQWINTFPFAESDGLIYDNLMDCVNNEFNEYGEAQEPMILKLLTEAMSRMKILILRVGYLEF